MTTPHGVTTEKVFSYLRDNPGSSLEEIAETLHLPSRGSAWFHVMKLARAGRVQLGGGKHRQYKITGEE
jgi:predicted transcriptional regulator